MTFDQLFTQITAAAGRFGHRQHVELTWRAVRQCGMPDAIDLICQGIQRTARYAGAPQKYHVTISRAWVELVAHHVAHDGSDDFEAFATRNPLLLDKRLLTRFYRSTTLVDLRARTSWVEPDLAPFPWLR
jgi:hypothetical protein